MTGHIPPPARRPGRAPRLLSLGAGIQSTAVLLLACDGATGPFDVAFFADIGWEPRAVYDNVDRLRVHAARAGIPVRAVSAGNTRQDAVDVRHRFASMSLHVRTRTGPKGLARRQCTSEYKIRPLTSAARTALGHPSPRRIPRGVFAEQAIGISVDYIGRAKDADVSYLKNVFPLLDLGWTRADCESYPTACPWVGAVKSACLGCPFHSNWNWRGIRDNDPQGWADVVLFDRQISHGHPSSQATGRRYFLHPSRRPLDEVDLDRPARRRHATTAATADLGGRRRDRRDRDRRRPGRLLAVGVPLRPRRLGHRTEERRMTTHTRSLPGPAVPGASRPTGGRRHTLSILLWAVGFAAALAAANLATTRWGPVAAGFGLSVTAGTYTAGLALALRDGLHDAAGIRGVLAALTAGIALSAVTADPRIVVASTIAAAAGELADLAAYLPLRDRIRRTAVAVSGAVGGLVDTVGSPAATCCCGRCGVLYLGNASSPAVRDAMATGEIGMMVTPAEGRSPAAARVWAADNGCFGAGYPGDHAWTAWLARLQRHSDRCLFAIAPDVVADAAALLRSAPHLPVIRRLGYPAALVAQDGLQDLRVPWSDFDVLFLGGSTDWKLGAAAADLTAQALAHGKAVHMGRVNSARRWNHALRVGCDSVDGTCLTYAPDANLARIRRWALPAPIAASDAAAGSTLGAAA